MDELFMMNGCFLAGGVSAGGAGSTGHVMARGTAGARIIGSKHPQSIRVASDILTNRSDWAN